MRISVQSIHFNADKKLLAFIQKKAEKLDQFSDQILNAEVYLRLENTEDDSNKITEIKLNLPGSQLFVKEQCKSFEEATDIAVETLRRQVSKLKTKARSRMSSYKNEVISTYAMM
jgi:putative sigma-54 modulation protein